ncbi:MAG: HD domain-containing phosphohydrolase [Candidatus Firestonebacteria bacterium]
MTIIETIMRIIRELLYWLTIFFATIGFLSFLKRYLGVRMSIFHGLQKRFDSLFEKYTKLQESEKMTKEELLAVYSVLNVGLSSLDINEILQQLIQKMVEVTNSNAGLILLRHDDTDEFILKASYRTIDVGQIKKIIKPSDGFLGRVIKEGKTIVSYKELKDDFLVSLYKKGNTIMPMLGVPLKLDNKLIGVVQLIGREEYAFKSGEIKLIEILASKASISIGRAKTYHEKEEIINDISMVAYVGSSIMSTLNVEEVLHLITKIATQVMHCRTCTLRLLEEKNKELVLKALYGVSSDYVKKGNIKIGKSIAGRVVTTKNPIAVSDLNLEQRFEYMDIIVKEGLKSLLCVPLIVRGKAIGTLTVYSSERIQFADRDIKLLSTFASMAAAAIENANLFQELQSMYFNTVKSIVSALDARDSYTKSHSEKASKYAIAIAEDMHLSDREREIVQYGAVLHDIGKIGIEDKILRKVEKLTEEEYKIIKEHPLIAAKILEPLVWFKDLIIIITHHHEHYDGSGYPSGLAKEKIPLLSRVLLVVDAFEAMTSDRPYRKAMKQEYAVKELEKNKGTQFDPKVVDSLVRVLSKTGDNGK